MASNRQKLLVERYGPDPYFQELCGSYCDGNIESSGICPRDCCLHVCPDICKIPAHEKHRLSLWLTVFLAILATAFLFFTCYSVYKIYSSWYNHRRRGRATPSGEEDGPDTFLDEDQGPVVDHPIWYIRTIGLQPSVISAIAAVKYKRGDGLIDGTDCAVCLNEFEEDETLRLLPKCNHAFHIPCIDTWLRSHTNCPICRAGIVSNSQGPVARNPGLMEETGAGGSSREVRREPENEASEVRIGIDDACSESRAQIGLTNNENLVGGEGQNHDAGGFNGEQPMRRSVSVDSFSAAAITASIANAAAPWHSSGRPDKQLVDDKERTSSAVIANKGGINQSLLRLVGGFSMERSAQMGTSSIKRSLSCSAKVFLSKHSNRSHDSVMPR